MRRNQSEHKTGKCIPCRESVAHFHRPAGGGPWFCYNCGIIEGEGE